MNDDHIYKIEPLPSHLTKHVTVQGSAPHIISRRSLHKDRKKRSQPVKGAAASTSVYIYCTS